MSAMQRLGQRMAARNNLGLFAWVAAVLLPCALQLIAGMQEEVRSYLEQYYGPFTLYFFFVMTYGFATIFVCFYQLGSYRRQGTLDMLRIARMTPWEVLRDVFLQLQRVLLPPILGFAVVFTVYTLFMSDRTQIMGFGRTAFIGGVLNVVLTEMLLCAIICTGLLRNEAALSLLSAFLVLPLNIAPIALMFFAEGLAERWKTTHLSLAHPGNGNILVNTDHTPMPLLLNWFTSAPWLFYIAGMATVLALLLWLGKVRLAALWPPQLRGR
jgi:hypothetical protein